MNSKSFCLAEFESSQTLLLSYRKINTAMLLSYLDHPVDGIHTSGLNISQAANKNLRQQSNVSQQNEKQQDI